MYPVTPVVRGEVRRTLDNSQAFRALPPDRRRQIAHDMVTVVGYMVEDSGWLEPPDEANAIGADVEAHEAIDQLRAQLGPLCANRFMRHSSM